MKILPSMKQLEYLVSLEETVHFAKASEQCNVTPSTLSAGIKDLENLFGLSLAERSKRHVHMTSIGLDIARRARHILRDAEEIMELAKRNKEPMSSDIKLGVIPTISPFLLPQAIATINKKYPQLRLFLEENLTNALLDRVQQGDLDAALIAIPYDTRSLEKIELFDDEFLFACNYEHSLSQKHIISDKDLAKESLMLLEEGHCLRSHVLNACHLDSHRGRSNFEASSFFTLVQMVASGIGVTLLPKLAINSKITEGTRIKTIPMSTPYFRKIALVWRKSSLRSHEYQLLAEAFKII
jgi:LysR family hydrogen peroxide-inducible transcriptional activator